MTGKYAIMPLSNSPLFSNDREISDDTRAAAWQKQATRQKLDTVVMELIKENSTVVKDLRFSRR
jgi:hypothetical protein